MPQTKRQCSLCGETDPPPKQCSACKKACYCSVDCQRYDWFRHIFDRKPSRPITTADHLALAIDRCLIPEHFQTRTDYGFEAASRHDAGMLLGLYMSLLDPDRLAVKPYTLHKWRVNSTLVDNIKKEFDRLPEGGRGTTYTWFLQNQDVITRKIGEQEVRAHLVSEIEESTRQAYHFIGRPPTTSLAEINRWCRSLPDRNLDCFFFYAMLLSESRPGPSMPTWIVFAFCACENRLAESHLFHRYCSLIRKVTFDEFCNAFRSSSLPSLFREKGLGITNLYILDVLTSPPMQWKSVWLLKKYVESKMINDPEDTQTRPADSVLIDYGFINCKAADEHKLLLDTYKAFFAMEARANPLELHKARIEGRLYEYFAEDLGFILKPRKTYQRLLKGRPPHFDI